MWDTVYIFEILFSALASLLTFLLCYLFGTNITVYCYIELSLLLL